MSEWSTVSLDLDPLLDPIDPILKTIDSVLAMIIAILQIVNAILNVIKAFLLGLLDPIRPIIEAIINEIRNFIHDLRQIGVYITGDWKLCKYPFKDMVGGYGNYEKRMLSRLMDTTDPNRPNWSSRSGAVAAFFYVSSGDIWIIIKLIQMIKKFFGQDWAIEGGAFPSPSAPTISFATTNIWEGSFGALKPAGMVDAEPPGIAIEWKVPTPPGPAGLFGRNPKGFLVHVSTVPNGFKVIGTQPNTLGSSIVGPTGGFLGQTVSAGVDWNTNGPTYLYGGLSDLAPTTGGWNGEYNDLERDSPQAGKLFLIQDENTPWIKPNSLLDSAGKCLVAKTFFAPAGAGAIMAPGQSFRMVIKKEDLPKAVDWEAGSDGFAQVVSGSEREATEFSIRIRALGNDKSDDAPNWPPALFEAGKNFGAKMRNPMPLGPGGWPEADSDPPEGGGPYIYGLSEITNSTNGVLKNALPFSAYGLISASSPAVAAKYPTATQLEFIRRTQTALLLGLLCRPDLRYREVPGYGPLATTEAYEFTNPQFPKNTAKKAPEFLLSADGSFEATLMGIIQKTGLGSRYRGILYDNNRCAAWRNAVRRLLIKVATLMQEAAQLPDEVTQPLLENSQTLADFKMPGSGLLWEGLNYDLVRESVEIGTPNSTLLEAFGLGPKGKEDPAFKDTSKGFGANPLCRGGVSDKAIKRAMMQDMGLRMSSRLVSSFNIDNPRLLVMGSVGHLYTNLFPEGVPDSNPQAAAYTRAIGEWEEAVDRDDQVGFKMGDGTADWSPCIFGADNSVFVYVRDYVRLFSADGPTALQEADMVLTAASAALGRPSADSEWIAIRLMPNALSGADQLLDAIEKFLYGILDALKGLIDKIIAYIEGIQARIYQLQALIEWIRSLLKSLELFAIGPMGALVVTGSGTAGITTEFMMAENKPQDGAGAYSGGVLVTAGGIPTFLLELLALLLGKVD